MRFRIAENERAARDRRLLGAQKRERTRARSVADRVVLDEIASARRVAKSREGNVVQRAVRHDDDSGIVNACPQRRDEPIERLLRGGRLTSARILRFRAAVLAEMFEAIGPAEYVLDSAAIERQSHI